MLRQRHQYRLLQAAFVFALVGIAFFGGYAGMHPYERAAEHAAKHSSSDIYQPETVWGWLTSTPEAAAAVILCFITAALAIVTYALYWTTSRLATDAEKTGTKQLELAGDTAERQLRAYVATGRLKIEAIRQSDGKTGYLCHVRWRNKAFTPARNVAMCINRSEAGEKHGPKFYLIDGERDPRVQSVAVIGPNRGLESTVGISSETAFLIPALEDGHPFYIWGWIEYDDVFAPKTPRRRTEFCFRIRGQEHGLPGLRFTNHSAYNAMDEDCERQPAPR